MSTRALGGRERMDLSAMSNVLIRFIQWNCNMITVRCASGSDRVCRSRAGQMREPTLLYMILLYHS